MPTPRHAITPGLDSTTKRPPPESTSSGERRPSDPSAQRGFRNGRVAQEHRRGRNSTAAPSQKPAPPGPGRATPLRRVRLTPRKEARGQQIRMDNDMQDQRTEQARRVAELTHHALLAMTAPDWRRRGYRPRRSHAEIPTTWLWISDGKRRLLPVLSRSPNALRTLPAPRLGVRGAVLQAGDVLTKRARRVLPRGPPRG